MLLSYNRLLELVRDGVITGVAIEDVNSSSIDIHLAPKLLVEEDPARWEVRRIALWKGDTLKFTPVDCKDGFWLQRGMFVLGSSLEKFNLPNNISAEYKLKSSLARSGLEHLAAGWCDAGWHDSRLTLELTNMTQHHLLGVKAGMKIGQVCFFEHEEVPEHASYANRGQYNGDKEVQTSKGINDGTQNKVQSDHQESNSRDTP